jgi:hypothetical protein
MINRTISRGLCNRKVEIKPLNKKKNQNKYNRTFHERWKALIQKVFPWKWKALIIRRNGVKTICSPNYVGNIKMVGEI